MWRYRAVLLLAMADGMPCQGVVVSGIYAMSRGGADAGKRPSFASVMGAIGAGCRFQG